MAETPTSEPAPAATQTDGETINQAWQGVQKILNKFISTLNELKTVKVTTLVTDLQIVTEQDENTRTARVTGVQPLPDPNVNKAQGLVTEIDMLEGDIRYFRSKGLQAPLDVQLQAVHAEHVELARKIFHDNIQFVADTIHSFRQSEQ